VCLLTRTEEIQPLSLVFQVDPGRNDNVLAGAIVRITACIWIIRDSEIIDLDEVHLQYAHVFLARLTADDFIRHNLVCFCIM
jgi:hypothetical protein